MQQKHVSVVPGLRADLCFQSDEAMLCLSPEYLFLLLSSTSQTFVCKWGLLRNDKII